MITTPTSFVMSSFLCLLVKLHLPFVNHVCQKNNADSDALSMVIYFHLLTSSILSSTISAISKKEFNVQEHLHYAH